MILGKDYINGHQEEKLYSTGDEMLDNLLERAFCEGYELAQREYAEEEKKKIKELDKRNIEALKKLYDKDEELKDIHLKQVDEDPETRKEGNKQNLRKGTKKAVKIGAAGTAAASGLTYGLSRLLGKDRRKSAKFAGDALVGGAIGSLVGLGSGSLLNKRIVKDYEKDLIEGKENALKSRDIIRVAAGQMSEEEFAEKWGE